MFLIDGGWDRDDGLLAIANEEFVVLQIAVAIDSSMSPQNQKPKTYCSVLRFFVGGESLN